MKSFQALGLAAMVAAIGISYYLWPAPSETASSLDPASAATAVKSAPVPKAAIGSASSVESPVAPSGGLRGASEDLPQSSSANNPPSHKKILQVMIPAAAISMPLVLEAYDPAALKLQAGQLAALEEMQELFVQMLGEPPRDSSDPAYAERWEIACAKIDTLLRTHIGTLGYARLENAVLERKLQAARSHQP